MHMQQHCSIKLNLSNFIAISKSVPQKNLISAILFALHRRLQTGQGGQHGNTLLMQLLENDYL